MGRKSKVEDASHKQKLTLAELAGHDDVCSDVMIDNAYYKAKIRKYRPKHIPVRGIKEDDVPQILLHKVIVGKDVVAAEKELLKLQGLKRYLASVKSKIQREHFLDHLRKYIYMYQTDCPWEVSTTNRYTITTYEAAVTARRRIKQGETIKYLTGTLVPLSSEESMDLDLTNRNFSIVLAGRKKSDQMFLGPARFSNHDCDANGRLMMKGTESMTVMAVKNINVGDEITVSYGDNYFGPDNVECLCHTCEVKERNGWTSKAAFTQPQSGTTTPLPDVLVGTSSIKKRKRDSNSTSPAPGSLKRLKAIPSPSKLHYSWTPPCTSESEVAHEDVEEVIVVQQGSPTNSTRTDEEETPKRDGKGRFVPKSDSEPRTQRPRGRPSTQRQKSLPLSPPTTSASSQDSENERGLDVRSASEEPRVPVTIKIEAVEKTTIETDDPIADLINEKDAVDASPEPELMDEIVTPRAEQRHDTPVERDETLAQSPQAVTVLSMTKVSTIASIEPVPDSAPGKDLPTIIPSIEPPIANAPLAKVKTVTHANLSVHPVGDTIRVPGDYILTRKLLAQPHDRWVRCHNDLCHAFFLQPNGYQTRRECPRCERHSILYGFTWPKTDPDPRKLLAREPDGSKRGRPKTAADGKPEPVTSKYTAYRRQGRCGKGTWVEGGGDEEERVMDHRTIHRFVLPEEERELTRKGLLVEAEMARNLGEDSLEALKSLDGKGRRELGRDSSARTSEGLGREESEVAGNASGSSSSWRVLDDGEDEQGRRRSGRIVESRVYVNVCMKR